MLCILGTVSTIRFEAIEGGLKMEGVSLLEYKDALMQAAWETGSRYLATDAWGASGQAEQPLVAVEVPYRKR